MWWVALGTAATIEGQVVDENGDPVSNADVVAYDQRFRFAQATTDDDGNYTLEVPPNTYRVRFIPPRLSTAQELWEGETLSSCEAPTHPLGETDVLPLDMELPIGGTLTGQIFKRDHSPLVDAKLEVYPTWYREVGTSVRSVRTDEDGVFTVYGLPRFRTLPDTYFIELDPSEVPEQYYRGSWFEEDAEPVEVDADVVDMGPFSVRDGVELSGVLTGPDGPIGGGEIHVFAGRFTRVVVTEPDGSWTIGGLQPGEVLLWATAPGYARTYWPSIDRPPEERLFVEAEGDVVTDLDIEMPFEVPVTGTVVTSGDPTLATVLLVNDDGSVGLAGPVTEDGTFSVAGIDEGTWFVEVYGADLGIVEGTLFDDAGEPVSIEVVAGEPADLGRLVPTEGGEVSGLVTDSASGLPVYGAAVIAENQDLGVRRLGFTAADGTYAVSGLVPGSWSLTIAYSGFCVTDPSWVSVYWPQQVNPNVGGTVNLSAGEIFDWSPEMPPDADLDEMGDDWEVANGLDPTVNDAEGDPDGDGFTNLVEYRLGTDPNQQYDRGCSCAGTRVMLFLPLLSLFGRRRS